jgi:prepilin-type N-terminal cleavage/methylation domain-containing protein
MRKRHGGFTLVELLTVMAILAILYAIMLPVAKAARAAAFQYNASNAIRQLGTATTMYASDYDDQCPPAYYWTATGVQTWFGQQDPTGYYDPKLGLLSPYTNGRTLKDPTHFAKDWLGDKSGFGYNWGQIGSDAHIQGGWTNQYGCFNPARMSELSNPSGTVFYATSAIMSPKDHQIYDFGFVYEPYFWGGNPPVDFRHQGGRIQDPKTHEWINEGLALAVMGDGHVRVYKRPQMKDQDFLRFQPTQIP